MPTLLFRYAVVGMIGTVVHIGSTMILVEFLMVNPVTASIIGFVLTVLLSFYLNSCWTFGVPASDASRLIKYATVSLLGLLLNTLIMYLTVEVFVLDYRVGLVLLVLIIPVHNFSWNYLWSFRGVG